jgi:hypothetical protein
MSRSVVEQELPFTGQKTPMMRFSQWQLSAKKRHSGPENTPGTMAGVVTALMGQYRIH